MQLVFCNGRATELGRIFADACLQFNPDRRPTAQQAASHPYFVDDQYVSELSTALEHLSEDKLKALVVNMATHTLRLAHNHITAYALQHGAKATTPDVPGRVICACSGTCGAALCERNKKLRAKFGERKTACDRDAVGGLYNYCAMCRCEIEECCKPRNASTGHCRSCALHGLRMAGDQMHFANQHGTAHTVDTS